MLQFVFFFLIWIKNKLCTSYDKKTQSNSVRLITQKVSYKQQSIPYYRMMSVSWLAHLWYSYEEFLILLFSWTQQLSGNELLSCNWLTKLNNFPSVLYPVPLFSIVTKRQRETEEHQNLIWKIYRAIADRFVRNNLEGLN